MDKLISLNINGQNLLVAPGTTVLQAAEQAGITIPTLCDHPDLTPYGGCRLCVVDVKGYRTPMASCALEATEGMVVTTENESLTASRRMILEMLLSNYYDAGYETGLGETQFEHWVRHYGLDAKALSLKAPIHAVDADPNPFVWVDMNKCIVCHRCVRACAEIQGRFVWGPAGRGFATHMVAGSDQTMLDARCESCGACVAYCPTGALNNKMSMHEGLPDRTVQTTCTYCGVGCQFDLHIKDDVPGGRVIRVSSNHSAPVNGMHLCVKGRYGYDFIHHEQRLQRPRVRRYLLEGTVRPQGRGEWVETDWDTALGIVTQKLAGSRATHGSDSVGVLCSAKCTNEENYLMNKLARQVIGTHNIDHCARL
jgi:formate dehydrogenase major subunit/formate dehydrogenase alpha subunit